MTSILFAQVYSPVFQHHFQYLHNKGHDVYHVTNDPRNIGSNYCIDIFLPKLQPLDPFQVSHGLSLASILKYPDPLTSIEDILHMDRIARSRTYKYSYQEILQLLSQLYNYISMNKIDIVVSGRDSSLHILTYIVCLHFNIKFLCLTRLRIPQNCYIFTPSPFSYSASPQSLSSIKYFKDYSSDQCVSTFNQPLTKKRYPVKDFFRNFLYYFHIVTFYLNNRFLLISSGILNYQLGELLSRFCLRLSNSSSISVRKVFSNQVLSNTASHVLFCLQTQPESSIDVEGYPYIDQLKVINSICTSLHTKYKLIVKPHPGDYNIFPASFYKHIQSIPNAILVPPSTSTPTLLELSKLVITISGTIGLESLLLNKPTIILGSVWFKHLLSTNIIFDFQTLEEVLANPDSYIDSWNASNSDLNSIYDLYLANSAYSDYNRSYSNQQLSDLDVEIFCKSILLNA